MFFKGLQDFLATLNLIRHSASLRAWYIHTLVRTFFVAMLVLLVLGLLGSWFMLELAFVLMGQHDASLWAGWVMVVLFWVALLYLSGVLTFTLSSSLVGVIVDEHRAIQEFFPASVSQGWVWSSRIDELKSVLISVVVSLLCFPLFFVPPLIPLALLFVAWALGKECFSLGRRLAREYSLHRQQGHVELKYSRSYAMGLGFIPSVLLLIPALGWLCLPVLILASLRVQKSVAD